MKYLHIIKDPRETWAWEVAEAQVGAGHEVAILLWQDGVLARRQTSLPLYAAASDLDARALPVGRFKAVDYGEVVDLIFQYDRVTCW
ncbi:MAG: DsrH/TusB family sulfur metabolism protein [Candidatus Methylomirabilales bacterium]